jgi:hypothetical protein
MAHVKVGAKKRGRPVGSKNKKVVIRSIRAMACRSLHHLTSASVVNYIVYVLGSFLACR